MNIFGADVPAFTVLFGSLIGALFIGIGVNVSGELVKSLYKIIFKKRFEAWLKTFDHHGTSCLKKLANRKHNVKESIIFSTMQTLGQKYKDKEKEKYGKVKATKRNRKKRS